MKHFLFFVFMVFSLLAGLFLYKEDNVKSIEDKKIHVYASSSFIAKWGPGPALKDLFEKQNLFKVEFVESPDVNVTLQKISMDEGSNADVVLGLDQYDISRLGGKIKWRDIDRPGNLNYSNEIKLVTNERTFVPYDWAPLTFVMRKDSAVEVASLNDLLKPELKTKIALQDPRTSSPGLQFLVWVFENKNSEDAVKFLKELSPQVHSYAPSWSASYGLFTSGQADLVFSHVTSPVYHQVEEKNTGYLAAEIAEALPVQVEFAGIPASCKNCEAAEMFVAFLLSDEAQRTIMSKNYMLPVNDKVKEGTAFDAVKKYKTLPIKFYDQSRVEKWLNTWAEIRKNEGN
jgi:thiamine transport system substrate-binding protein